MSKFFHLNIITMCLFASIETHRISRRQTGQIQKPDHSIIMNDFGESRENITNYNTEEPKSVDKASKSTEISYATGKKWKVGKVSRKHYEIVNMLWRKTNVFDDEADEDITEAITTITTKSSDRTTDKNNEWIAPITVVNTVRSSKSCKQTSTPSYIEFYYLDEAVDQKIKTHDQHALQAKQTSHKTASNILNNKDSRLPFFVFHVNEPLITFMSPFDTAKKTAATSTSDHTHSYTEPKVSAISLDLRNSGSDKATFKFLQKSERYPDSSLVTDFNTRNKNLKTNYVTSAYNDTKYSGDNTSNTDSTKAYDKIKFFEIYDSNTLEPTKSGQSSTDDDENVPVTNDLENDDKILLAHIDKDLKQTEAISVKKYEKKHVKSFEYKLQPIEEFEANLSVISLNSSESVSTESILKRYKFFNNNYSEVTENISSRYVSWSEYPFVAVYVYELYRIYCDAAIISPHWLLASGSCLSQHRIKDMENTRSAYITYCGSNWWDPERITYVKSCTIHPRYNTMDERKYLYNIGLIQVISSMALACHNWTPVSLMSHQFGAESDGSYASAVGWGLDRFITRPVSELPRSQLSVFDGKVFTNSCPGNSVYERLHYRSSEYTKNIYCLLLPPYAGEENDAVHGGLLFVGGQLIALYLQEERRHFGHQSAMYTGIWKLVPWINRVAREPEEADFLV